VLNGNGFGAASPNALTANAAVVLRAAGDQAIQLAYPAVTATGVLSGIAREINALSRGAPIGIVGFSAGGTLAERLAADPALNVTAVLACYSPPDLHAFFAYHQADRFSQYVLGKISGNAAVTDLLSGPNPTQAHVVATFGLKDRAVVAGPSTASLLADYPQAGVYDYPGPHGVGIDASVPALEDFLTHL
jgi:hypothetical protein